MDGRQGADSGALTDLATDHRLRTAESQELLNLHCERALPREEEDDAAMGRGRARPASVSDCALSFHFETVIDPRSFPPYLRATISPSEYT